MRQNSKAAKRYAKALLSYAIEQKELESVAEEMKLIEATCATSPDLVTLLKSPVVKPKKKRKILAEIFVGKIGTTTLNFLKYTPKYLRCSEKSHRRNMCRHRGKHRDRQKRGCRPGVRW